MPSAAPQTSFPELPLALEFALNSAGYAISHDLSSDSGRVAIVFLQVPPNRVFAIYTLEVGNQNLVGPMRAGRPSERVALSGDGRLLLVTAPTTCRCAGRSNQTAA